MNYTRNTKDMNYNPMYCTSKGIIKQKPKRPQSKGFTAQILKACLTSILAMKQPLPIVRTMLTASSNLEYRTVKNSMGIPSFTEDPAGEDRFKMIHTVPSYLGTAPSGEQ